MKNLKRFLLVTLLSVSFVANAQHKVPADLVFNKSIFDCENNWVAFPKKTTDSVYAYGFIYLDATAGFTFQLESFFSIGNDGELLGKPKNITGTAKYRLDQNASKVSLLTTQRQEELGLPAQPKWLSIYAREEPVTPADLTRRGKHFNHVGAFAKAFQDLNKAYQLDPHFNGLEFELAYYYNATQAYQKAVDILISAIKNDDKNFWFYRELGYSYMNLKKIDDAELTYEKGIAMSTDKKQQAEMAYNMAYTFFQQKNKTKFESWSSKTRSVADPESQFVKNLDAMQKQML
jgi:tetratricopeptide (TPR) repeat protein